MLTRRRFVSNSAALSTALALTPAARYAMGKSGPGDLSQPNYGRRPSRRKPSARRQRLLSHPFQLRLCSRTDHLALVRPDQLASCRRGSPRLSRRRMGALPLRVPGPFLHLLSGRRRTLCRPCGPSAKAPGATPSISGSAPSIRRTSRRTARRYLYMAGGRMAELNPDGLVREDSAADGARSVAGAVRHTHGMRLHGRPRS